MRDLEKDYAEWFEQKRNLADSFMYIIFAIDIGIFGLDCSEVIWDSLEMSKEDTDLAIEKYNSGVMHELYSKLPDVVLCKRYGAKINKEVVL